MKLINLFEETQYKIKYLNKDGKLHRSDGPARIWADGSKEWYINDKLHREDGPAIIDADGYKAWYINGKLHRTDGPAAIWSDGIHEWWINDTYYGNGDKPPQEWLDAGGKYEDLFERSRAETLDRHGRIKVNRWGSDNEDETGSVVSQLRKLPPAKIKKKSDKN